MAQVPCKKNFKPKLFQKFVTPMCQDVCRKSQYVLSPGVRDIPDVTKKNYYSLCCER